VFEGEAGNDYIRITDLGFELMDGGMHGNFHTYTSDAAVLLVGVNVTTDFV
jgi:hypothetical protein